MRYIFDSDTLTYLYNLSLEQHAPVLRKFRQPRKNDLVQISFMTLYELEYSFHNASALQQVSISRQMEDIEKRFSIIPFQREHASIYGVVKTKLRKARGTSKKGMRKHNIDLIIASTAIFTSSVLVANDDIYSDLQEIYSEFQYENWTL